MHTLKAGDLAYFDSFSGMIPCKVLGITGRSGIASTAQVVAFKLTAGRRAYKAGEKLECSGLHVVPRKSVRGNRIRAYQVEASN